MIVGLFYAIQYKHLKRLNFQDNILKQREKRILSAKHICEKKIRWKINHKAMKRNFVTNQQTLQIVRKAISGSEYTLWEINSV